MQIPALRTRLLVLGVALITVVTFGPSLWNEFVDWDDSVLLGDNPAYRGLGWVQLRWMATNVWLGHYVPLTWLTFGVDYMVWGMNPVGYHFTNLLLHAANGVLVYFLAARLLEQATALPGTARQLGAATAALFFAIHPLRVESVAWVTERRGVLSGLFFLATVLLYLKACRAARERRWWLLAGSVGTYVLALASKASVMTLPLVLVLLDVYPLGRLPVDPRRWWARAARRVWAEKVPYVVLGVCGAVVSYYAAVTGAVVFSLEPYQWAGLALQSLWFYVYKTLIPLGLSPLYELSSRARPLEPRFLAGAIGVTAISVGVLSLRRVWPAGVAAWVYYAIVLAPVSGIAHAGPQFTADRYSYLPCLGWAVLVGAGAGVAVRAAARRTVGQSPASLVAAAAIVGFVGLGGLTWRQVQVWHDSERLWRHAVSVTPDCSICRINLGAELLNRRQYTAALEHFRAASALRPDRVMVHANIGRALAGLGRDAEAIEHYERALVRFPDAVSVRANLATALAKLGRLTEAVGHLQYAVRMQKAGEATAFFQATLRSNPDAVIARLGLMEAYRAVGMIDLAREQFDALQALNPALAKVAGAAFTPDSSNPKGP